MSPTLAAEPYCYLTTVGRRTGNPHRIEIWFAARPDASTIYLLSGRRDRADWVRNLQKQPACTVEIGAQRFRATGRVVSDKAEDALARELVYDKYKNDDDLEEWKWEALPVAFELSEP